MKRKTVCIQSKPSWQQRSGHEPDEMMEMEKQTDFQEAQENPGTAEEELQSRAVTAAEGCGEPEKNSVVKMVGKIGSRLISQGSRMLPHEDGETEKSGAREIVDRISGYILSREDEEPEEFTGMRKKKLEEYLKGYGTKDFYEVRCYEETGSTNEDIKIAAAEGAEEGLVITADEQTAGKGRSGRSWKTPRGESAAFSILLKPELPPEQISAVTLVMGLSLAQTVKDYLGLEAAIKWPNDVVIGGKKIGGILTEAHTTEGKIDWIVVGTGINISNQAFDPAYADHATSLSHELNGEKLSCEQIVAAVLARFLWNYRIFLMTGDLTGIRNAYNELLVSRGKEVRIEDPAGAYTAVSQGIDPSGALIVTLEDGSEQKIAYGEVSVRGLYGYV